MGRQQKGDKQRSIRSSTSRPTTTPAIKRRDTTTTKRPNEAKASSTRKPAASSIGPGTPKSTTTSRPRNGATSRGASAGTTPKPTTTALQPASTQGGNEKREDNSPTQKGGAGIDREMPKGEDNSLKGKQRKCAVVKLKSRCGWNSSKHCKWVGDSCVYVNESRGLLDSKGGSSGPAGKSTAAGFQNSDYLGPILLIIILMLKFFRF